VIQLTESIITPAYQSQDLTRVRVECDQRYLRIGSRIDVGLIFPLANFYPLGGRLVT
jgi:hypothetical protein